MKTLASQRNGGRDALVRRLKSFFGIRAWIWMTALAGLPATIATQSADYRFTILESGPASPGFERTVSLGSAGEVVYLRRLAGVQDKELIRNDGESGPVSFGGRRRFSQFHALAQVGMPVTQELTTGGTVRTGILLWRSPTDSVRLASSGINDRWKQLRYSGANGSVVETVIENGIHDVLYVPLANARGSVAYLASGGLAGNLKTRLMRWNLSERLAVDAFDGNTLPLRPVMSADDAFAVSVKTLPAVYLYLPKSADADPDYRRVTIATSPQFKQVGQAVGISDQGRIVAFGGDETGTAAAIYASVPTVAQRALIQLTQPSEFDEIALDSRVGVIGPDSTGEFSVVFVAVRDGVRGVYRLEVRPAATGFPWTSSNDFEVGSPIKILAVGDEIFEDRDANDHWDAQTEPKLEGQVTELELWMPVNRSGQVACWIGLGEDGQTATQAIVRATPSCAQIGKRLNSPYYNLFDTEICKWADRFDIPRAILKAIVIQEAWDLRERKIGDASYPPQRSFLYEPDIDAAIQGSSWKSDWDDYRVPEHSPDPAAQPYGLVVSDNTTAYQWCSDSSLSNLVAKGKRNLIRSLPTGETQYGFVAQYRVASSYGLGQIVYRWHYDRLEELFPGSPPESLYDVATNVAMAAQYIDSNKTSPNLTRGNLNFDDWQVTVARHNRGPGLASMIPAAEEYVGHVRDKFIEITNTTPSAASPSLACCVPTFRTRRTIQSVSPPAVPGESLESAAPWDVKGAGTLQQVEVVREKKNGLVTCRLRVRTGNAQSPIEWESPALPATGGGSLMVNPVEQGGTPLLQLIVGAGMRGTLSRFYRWSNGAFVEVPGLDATKAASRWAFFADRGVARVQPDGSIQVPRTANFADPEAVVDTLYVPSPAGYFPQPDQVPLLLEARRSEAGLILRCEAIVAAGGTLPARIQESTDLQTWKDAERVGPSGEVIRAMNSTTMYFRIRVGD